MQESLVVRRERHVPASPAAVFALLTDPNKILGWMGTQAQVEPQPGGLYLVSVIGASSFVPPAISWPRFARSEQVRGRSAARA